MLLTVCFSPTPHRAPHRNSSAIPSAKINIKNKINPMRECPYGLIYDYRLPVLFRLLFCSVSFCVLISDPDLIRYKYMAQKQNKVLFLPLLDCDGGDLGRSHRPQRLRRKVARVQAGSIRRLNFCRLRRKNDRCCRGAYLRPAVDSQ